jgi:hypothetical protein
MQEIIKKFKDKGIVLNAPIPLENKFVEFGFETTLHKKEKSKNTLAFINSQKEYLDFLTNSLERIEEDSVLWFAYPKETSKIKTEIKNPSSF